jgi:hypothetical protein
MNANTELYWFSNIYTYTLGLHENANLPYIWNIIRDYVITTENVNRACQYNIEKIYTLYSYYIDLSSFKISIEYGNLDMITIYRPMIEEIDDFKELTNHAIIHNKLKIFKKINNKMIPKIWNDQALLAIEHGQLEILQYIVPRIIIPVGLIEHAAVFGQLESFQYIYTKLRVRISANILDNAIHHAAKNGHLNILQYIEIHTPIHKGIIEIAVRNGHLNICNAYYTSVTEEILYDSFSETDINIYIAFPHLISERIISKAVEEEYSELYRLYPEYITTLMINLECIYGRYEICNYFPHLINDTIIIQCIISKQYDIVIKYQHFLHKNNKKLMYNLCYDKHIDFFKMNPYLFSKELWTHAAKHEQIECCKYFLSKM